MTPGTGIAVTAPPAAPPTVSVVVCAYTTRRLALLRRALRSALDQDPAPQEVILVVDHAPDLLAALSAEPVPGVTLRENAGPRGLSGARNTGVAAARGDVVAFLDDDAEAAPGWLAGLVGAYADPAVVGTGGSVDPAWEVPPPAWFPPEFLWVVGCSYRGLPETEAPIRNPIGANMSFRRADLVAAGGFSTGIGRVGTLPLGCEETEAAIRVRARRPGSVVLQIPAARVRHFVPAERARWSYMRARCLAEGESKAAVARLVGTEAGLASERRYVSHVLPRGVASGLAGLAHGDAASGRRAAAIVAGFALTAAGYARGRARSLRRRAA